MDKHHRMLTNLHTFNVVARLLSFKKAAHQLSLTNSAISHRIRALEEQLGFKLFVRRVRSIELTAEGVRLLSISNRTFDSLYSEIGNINNDELSGEIYIATSPSIATCMLLPRLQSFQHKHPSLNVKLIAHPTTAPFDYEPIDLAIFYGNGQYPNYHCQRLLDEEMVPVCSRQYAQEHGLFEGTENLSNVFFLHGGEERAWLSWLDTMSLDINPNEKCYTFNSYDFAHTAAMSNLGIAIARRTLIEYWLKSGDLVAPFPATDTGLGYDVVCLPDSEKRPKYIAFMDWLHNESGILGES